MNNIELINMSPVLEILNSSLLSLPTPSSISYLWNIGFLLGITLTLQIVTGLVLSINFVADTELAFNSVLHIIRDIDSGWVIRYLHINGASLFFILIYLHVARGLYFNSFSNVPIVWSSGVAILLISIITAFMGYVLPWGQISFWGATVITSILSAVPYLGSQLTTWVWGNFSVSQPTLNRFFSLHFLLPLVITALVLVHLILLHQTGSSNPTGTNPDYDNIKFFPYFMVNDTTPMILISIIIITLVIINPNILGDVENFNPASPTTTPTHIQPEWYFLFAYAILRAIPSNLGGVLAMAGAILALIGLVVNNTNLNNKFNPTNNTIFWLFATNVALLTWIGANPVEYPYINIGAALTVSYFLLLILLSFYSLNEHSIFNAEA